MRWFLALALVSVTLCAVGTPAARAADREFCERYAHRAVEQARRARESRRCEWDSRGPRWSVDYRDHYDWCRDVRRDAAERENDLRHEHLERCRGR